MACKIWFGVQFNLSDSSDDDLYRLDQGHQWKMISIQLGSFFGAPKKKSSRGCLRVRPDANANADADADANCSKTICQLPLKGGRHNYEQCYTWMIFHRVAKVFIYLEWGFYISALEHCRKMKLKIQLYLTLINKT